MSDNDKNRDELRRLAEQRVSQAIVSLGLQHPDNREALVHELEVYHVELEMQNEELRRTQAELDESRRRYMNLYDFAPVGYLTTQGGMIVEANLTAATMLGVERSRVQGSGMSTFITEASRHAFYEHLRTVDTTEQGCNCEVKMRRHDKTEFYAQLKSRRENTHVHGQSRIRMAINDVTQIVHARRITEAHRIQMSQTWRMSTLGQMSIGIAHELSQPLSAIGSFAQSCRIRMQSSDADTAGVAKALDSIAAEAERASQVIRRIRRLVRTRRPVATALDLPGLIDESLDTIDVKLEDSGIQIVRRYAYKGPPIRADQIQIEEVVLNLVQNAVQAMKHHSISEKTLIVTICAADDFVEVVVADSGPGVPDDIAEQIFDWFYTTKEDGLGVGLALCRDIIETHRGRIWVDKAPRGGAAFHFTLPLDANAIKTHIPIAP